MPQQGIYRFTFTANANSDISIDYSTDGGNNFTPYAGNNKLQLNGGDSLQIALRGPSGWTMPNDLWFIIARANGAASGQNYSPFGAGWVWFDVNPSVSGTWSGSTWTSPALGGGIQSGNGQKKYEVTVAFAANLPNVEGVHYFSVDPEMDILT